MNTNLLNRITSHPNICHGKPCIRGMRFPVEVVLDMLGSGMTMDEILEDHPELEKEDVWACLEYAEAEIQKQKRSNKLVVLKGLQEAVEEVKEIKAGRRKGKTLKQFLNECRENNET